MHHFVQVDGNVITQTVQVFAQFGETLISFLLMEKCLNFRLVWGMYTPSGRVNLPKIFPMIIYFCRNSFNIQSLLIRFYVFAFFHDIQDVKKYHNVV